MAADGSNWPAPSPIRKTRSRRVLVNRVWRTISVADWSIRRAISASAASASHPELLDWLAVGSSTDGWSIKNLHRRIVLSKTYCQSSAGSTPADPENRLLSHFSRQRLDLEALRDSLLFVAGRLDFAIGGSAVDIVKEPFSNRRTVYGFIDRQNLPGLYRTFDFASPDTHRRSGIRRRCPSRRVLDEQPVCDSAGQS